jgi:uncharacterized YigZ family protein
MLFDDTYQTVERPATGQFRDRGSKFLAFAYPVASDAEVKPILTRLKAEHPKANHYCWAMRLTPDRSVFRVNDDGEPAGTAGRPILNILLSRDITNVLVVVIRYFGGILLGVPGLINAYKTATEDAIMHANVISKTTNDIYIIEFSYPQMNEVMKVLKEENVDILSQTSDTGCTVTMAIRKTKVNQVTAKLDNLHEVTLIYKKTE